MSQGEGRVIFEDQIDQIGEIQRDLGRFATHFARKQLHKAILVRKNGESVMRSA